MNPSALPYLLLHPQKLPIWHLCSPRQGQGYFPSVHELQASDEHQSGFTHGGHKIKIRFWDFPGGLLVKDLHFHCRERGSNCSQGN